MAVPPEGEELLRCGLVKETQVCEGEQESSSWISISLSFSVGREGIDRTLPEIQSHLHITRHCLLVSLEFIRCYLSS